MSSDFTFRSLRPDFVAAGSGGVLSFTPRALLEDPKGVLDLVLEAQRDPFWDIYMTPAVIAMVDELEAIQHKKGVVKG